MCKTWTTFVKDRICLDMLAENARMAERLQLYNVTTDAPAGLLDLTDDDTKTAAAASAWSSFNFQMLMSMSYRKEPLARVPPTLPIPGDSSAEDSTGRALPSYQGRVYIFVCKLWKVVLEMNYQYHAIGAVSLAVAEPIFQKLLAWADDLQNDIKRGDNTPDAVTNLHLWFHTVVLDLFRPFANLQPQPKLTTFTEKNTTPLKIVEASVKQLKRLIYNYRATSVSANYSMIYRSGMLYLMNHILEHYSDQEAHFYFLLCMQGWQRLARTFPFVGGVAQGVATMAVKIGAVLPADAFRLVDGTRSKDELIQDWKSVYPVDLQRGDGDPNTTTLGSLVNEFRSMRGSGAKTTDVPEGWKGDAEALFTTLVTEDGSHGIGLLAE